MMLPLFTFSFLVALVAASPADRLIARKCKTFTPSGPLFTTESKSFRASPGLFCDTPGTAINVPPSFFGNGACFANNSCAMGNEAINIPALPTLNISVANSSDEDDIYNLVAGVTGLDFNTKVDGNVNAGAVNFCFAAGIGLAVTVEYGLNCTNGTLSSCDSSTPDEGTAIQACAPSRVTNSIMGSRPNILFATENITQDDAGDMTDSPIALSATTTGPAAKNAAGHISMASFVVITEMIIFSGFWMSL